mgnify:CR=1 FL=1
MKKYNDVEVYINNKQYTVSGYESEEYIQKVATYINSKYNEYKNKDDYRFMDSDLKNILVQINIADDYHKAKEKISEQKKENEQKSNEIYDLKHEIISLQSKLNSSQKEIEELKKEINEGQKEIVRLETELGDSRKRSS